MLLLSLTVFTYFFCLAIKSLHKAIVIFAPISIVCQSYICLKYGSPAIVLSFAVEFVLVVLCFIRKGINVSKCPLSKPLLFLSLVQIIGVIASPLPVIQTLPNVIVFVFSYVYIILFYNELRTFKDLSLAIKSAIYVAIALVFYGLIEFTLQTNPFLSYVQQSIPYEYLDGKLYYVEGLSRFFSIRCQSIFAICISWGGYCALMIGFLFYIKDLHYLFFKRNFILPLILALIFCLLCTGTRSAYAYLGVCLLGGYTTFRNKTKYGLALVMIFLIILFMSTLLNMGTSFNAEEEGGSSIAMRASQLDAVLSVISNSPIFGLGVKGYEAAFAANNDIIGAESIWLQLLISSGLFGVFTQIYMYICSYQHIARNSISRKRILCFMFVFGWIVFSTLTSSPGLGDYYFLIIVVLIGKVGALQGSRI